MDSYKAFFVEEKDDGSFKRSIQDVPISFLPDHEVLIQVHYSDLNYKDGLSATGNKGVSPKYPFIPGVDASGVVMEDGSGTYTKGEEVVVTGYDLGQSTPGGFGGYIRVPAGWIVPLPKEMSLRDAMIQGTPAFTAAYGVMRLLHMDIKPENGPVLVSGATGGVGSFAVYYLAREGFDVTASTGKIDKSDYLRSLGAKEVINRDEFYDQPEKPLLKGTWQAAFDTVGGEMLDTIIRQLAHNGTVVCCGNIGGHKVESSIYPFILRGVGLLGVDSSNTLMPKRKKIWAFMEKHFDPVIRQWATEITLDELDDNLMAVLKGKRSGPVVLWHQH
jgi:putative YhdH/YhfP family quinone oxidoreductase